MNDAKLKRPVFEPARVRNISVAVYRKRLIQDSGHGADERMLAKDADGGLKMRGRAAALTGMGNWCPSFPSEVLSVEARSRNCANYAYMVADAMLKAREASHG